MNQQALGKLQVTASAVLVDISDRSDVGLMLAHRLRRRLSIDATSGRCSVFAGWQTVVCKNLNNLLNILLVHKSLQQNTQQSLNRKNHHGAIWKIFPSILVFHPASTFLLPEPLHCFAMENCLWGY